MIEPPRRALGALLVFAAVNAFGGGYYGLSGAPGVPVEWLAGRYVSWMQPVTFIAGCLVLTLAWLLPRRG